MKKTFKSFAAILLVFTMLMSLLPVGVIATDSITVYVSVVRSGEFTIGKNNETVAHVPVVVNSQTPTIDDAFTALHDTYYIDGASGYRTTQMPSYLQNIGWLDSEKVDIVPKDGVIFAEKIVTFYEGESVFNLLVREMKRNKIHLEFENTPIYNSAYIEGIANIYEFDCGELSGWLYKVNDWFPNYGGSRYQLKAGDKVERVYTCDLENDVGGYYSARNGN